MRILFSFLLLVLLAACASTDGVEDAQPAFSYPRMAPTAPPASPYEPAPAIEQPRLYVWRPGYWAYDSSAFRWVPGVVMRRPDPTAVWEADRWDKRGYGWVFVPGTWW